MPTIDSKLIEVVKGPETTNDTVATLSAWLRSFGYSTTITSNNIVRRVINAYWDEAVRLVSEGIPIAALDAAVRANGTSRGPLEQLDEIGFETVVDDVRRLMPLLAADMAGRGEGNGHGFYRYKRGVRMREFQAARAILWDARAIAGDGPKDPLASLDMLPPARALVVAGERLTLRIVNETAACLHEDDLANPADIDHAIARGADLLPFAGGPLRFADRRGLAWMVMKLAECASRIGPRFTPSPELVRRAAMGIEFHSNTAPQSAQRLAIRAA